MKITVIGYRGSFPGKNEATSGYLVQSGDKNLLIDCGSAVLSQLSNYIDLNMIDAVILSHYHADHISDIYCLQYQTAAAYKLGMRKKPLEIYAHNLDKKFNNLTYKNFCIAHPIDPDAKLSFGDLNIAFQWMNHGAPCLGMRLEEKGRVFAYSADTEWCERVLEISQNADIFLCECSLFNRQTGQLKGHLSAGEVGKIAVNSNVKKLVLTHLPQYGDLNELVKEAKEQFSGEVIKARVGLVLEL
ncbi:MBL fold metallo-hydrolase [Clostridium ganghwense]|uniref:MBL fold metallo-hydrolase n=1 Tax=Clostridium ganghwense TaxID=312089 RepID=A0ABT4CUF1_9CLOT|nr:MBL fold metallo-hydrolase [Clostridium ganghwense]MCY6372705.1 MBL fold metallo-hydrolase [Clostridium ganghwense]